MMTVSCTRKKEHHQISLNRQQLSRQRRQGNGNYGNFMNIANGLQRKKTVACLKNSR